MCKLDSGAFFFAEVGESFALVCEARQQRGWLPDFAVLAVKFGDARENLFQADRVRIPHGAAAIGGEAVAVEINNVYVRSAQGEPFFEDARAFVDESVEAAIHDFRGGNFALRDFCFGYPFADQFINRGIGHGAALLIIFVPTGACLLTEAA